MTNVCRLIIVLRCPVCNENLEDLGAPVVQEHHVKNCLEGGVGASAQAAKYLVYKLLSDSSLVGVECSFLTIAASLVLILLI